MNANSLPANQTNEVTKAASIVSEAVVETIPASRHSPRVLYRLAGDAYLLVEYGEPVLDLSLRFRVHALEQRIWEEGQAGILETIPGVRSLLIKFDCLQLSLRALVDVLVRIERTLPSADELEVASRLIRLPIAFHDRWTRETVEKYRQSIRSEAPYLPDNAEFVARCNALDDVEEVFEYLQKTEILVIGLGDVYLGAPCAVPLDPRYRLEAPKYNPARTYTCEGAVGIGGAFICIYPMESPGGYQLVGRTLPIWNTRQSSPDFAAAPWLLRYFDRIQFEAVSETELVEKRESVKAGTYRYEIVEGTFRMSEYAALLKEVRQETLAIKEKRAVATKLWTRGY
ncbi:MAG: carboxyltransferase domain-containing protein [Anaerolineales bacterium]|nr:carboxyltransferase domain-containing protein [Anaerolineales bacterium]